MNHITSPASARVLIEARRVVDLYHEHEYLCEQIDEQEKRIREFQSILEFTRAKQNQVLDQLARTFSLSDARLPDPGPDGIAMMDLPAVPIAPPSEMDVALREDEPSGDPERVPCEMCEGTGQYRDLLDGTSVCSLCGGTGKLLPETPAPPSINLLPEVPAPFEPAVPVAIPITGQDGETVFATGHVSPEITPETAEALQTMVQCAYDAATNGTLVAKEPKDALADLPESLPEESVAVLEEIVEQVEAGEPGEGFKLPDPETISPPASKLVTWNAEMGKRLKAAIKAAGVSIASVARDLGMRHDAVLHQWFSARMIPSTEQIDWLRERFPEAFGAPSEPYQTAEKAPQVTPEACQTVEPVVVTPLVRTKIAPLASGTMLHGWGEDEPAVRDAIDFGRAHFDRIFHVIRTGRNYSAEPVDFRPTPPAEPVMRLSLHSGEWHIKVLSGGLK